MLMWIWVFVKFTFWVTNCWTSNCGFWSIFGVCQVCNFIVKLVLIFFCLSSLGLSALLSCCLLSEYTIPCKIDNIVLVLNSVFCSQGHRPLHEQETLIKPQPRAAEPHIRGSSLSPTPSTLPRQTPPDYRIEAISDPESDASLATTNTTVATCSTWSELPATTPSRHRMPSRPQQQQHQRARARPPPPSQPEADVTHVIMDYIKQNKEEKHDPPAVCTLIHLPSLTEKEKEVSHDLVALHPRVMELSRRSRRELLHKTNGLQIQLAARDERQKEAEIERLDREREECLAQCQPPPRQQRADTTVHHVPVPPRPLAVKTEPVVEVKTEPELSESTSEFITESVIRILSEGEEEQARAAQQAQLEQQQQTQLEQQTQVEEQTPDTRTSTESAPIDSSVHQRDDSSSCSQFEENSE